MRTLTIVFGLLFFVFADIYAQKEKGGVELSKIRANKNQIDLDIKNIFNGLSGATLLYKRSFKTGKLIEVNAIQLLRFSGRINNQITFTEDPNREPDNMDTAILFPSDILNFQVGIGFERQKMNKRFVHYYGIDGVFNMFKNDDDFSNGSLGGITINATNSTDRLITSIRTGVNPFFGIKYYFTNQLSVGIETGIAILYFNQKITEISIGQDFVDNELVTVVNEEDPVVSEGLQTNFNNLRFLTVGYAF